MNDEGTASGPTRSGPSRRSLDRKFAEAAEAHATGLILVSPPGADDDRAAQAWKTCRSPVTGQDFPIIMMSQSAADAMVKAADKNHRSLLDFRKLADAKGEAIELPGAKVTLKTKIDKIDLMTDNVGAILPGKGKLADEFVVIGSHYDHVGYGYFGSISNSQGVIHPGARRQCLGNIGQPAPG